MNAVTFYTLVILCIAIYILVLFAFGCMCRYLFEVKGHSSNQGFWIGFFLGLIGFIYAFFLPNLNPPAQEIIIIHKNEDKK